MADPAARARAAFVESFGGAPDFVAMAPGRVNLIGEHTDYNDGFVLPMAIGHGTAVAARTRADGEVRVRAADFAESDSFRLGPALAPSADPAWSNYVRGTLAALAADTVPLAGAELAIAGDIPRGAGLSSSASLEVATGLAAAALAGQADLDRSRIALAGQRAEHEFAGCHCGIMDQLVSARAEAGAALLLDCRSLAARSVPMPADWTVMIVHSGVSRGLVEGAYNERRRQCEAAAAHFGAGKLRDVDMAALEAGSAGLDPTSLARARHVVSENARVLAAVAAIEAGDLAALGRLMAASHASMRDDFAITVPPVDDLVATLDAAIAGAGGARMTGGGFGGAVVAIMAREAVDAVRGAVLAGYRTPAGAPPAIMIERPAAGARLLG